MPTRKDTGSKGASGPNRGPGIGSHGEGHFLTRQGDERTKRVQSRQRSHGEGIARAAGKRLGLPTRKKKTEDSGQAKWRTKGGSVVTGPLSKMNPGKGDTRITGAEDDASVNYTSGRTGGNVRGPLSDVTQSRGDVRRRRGQRAS